MKPEIKKLLILNARICSLCISLIKSDRRVRLAPGAI